MKSVGETMSIGRSFNESLQKGFSSLEYGLDGLDIPQNIEINKQTIFNDLKIQSSQRLLTIGQALRLNTSVREINEITKYDNWFIDQLKTIIEIEKLIDDSELTNELILLAKNNGFTDKKIAKIKNKSEKEIRQYRHTNNIRPIFRLVDTCAGELVLKPLIFTQVMIGIFTTNLFVSQTQLKAKKLLFLEGVQIE